MNQKDKEMVLALYRTLMEELKQRSTLIGQLASGRLSLPLILTFELCQLQTRLICEIFALACLTAHGDIPDVKSAMMQKEYNAEKIIGRLSKLHPNFFPVPHTKEVSADAIPGARPARYHLNPIEGGFLTKEELLKTYNECGNYLHRGSIRRLLSKWHPDINLQKIFDWNQRLGSLLAPYHFTQLIGAKAFILCVMNNTDDDNNVQVAFAERIPELVNATGSIDPPSARRAGG
jgi:hypothetical protein